MGHPLSEKELGDANRCPKDRLGHVLRQVGIPADEAQRSGINKVDVARNQFPES